MKKKIIAISIMALLIGLSTLHVATGAKSLITEYSYVKSSRSGQNDEIIVNLENSGDGKTEYWALIVGLNDYEGPYDLPIDAIAFTHIYNVLCNATSWKKENIMFLKNEDATYDNIINGLRWLRENSDSDDVVLFFYSGHASTIKDEDGDEKDGKDEVIAPYDVKKIDGKAVGYISDDQLDDEFDSINAKGMCLVFDCCLAGGFADGCEGDSERKCKISHSALRKWVSPLKQLVNELTEILKKRKDFAIQFTADMNDGNNRVVLMSTLPGGLSAVGSNGDCFGVWVAEAFNNESTDKNGDGISAKEAFNVAKEIWLRPQIYVIILTQLYMLLKDPFKFAIWMIALRGHPILPIPTICDDYEGDLIIIPK